MGITQEDITLPNFISNQCALLSNVVYPPQSIIQGITVLTLRYIFEFLFLEVFSHLLIANAAFFGFLPVVLAVLVIQILLSYSKNTKIPIYLIL